LFAKSKLLLLAISLLAVAFIAACGSKTETNGAAASSSPSPSASPAPTASASPAAASKTPAASASPAATERTITDGQNRTVKVPANPKRVVVHLYAAELTSLGVKPVGTNLINASQVLSADQLKGIEDTGATAPSAEKVLSLNPDLIVLPDYLDPKDIEAMSKIAPTVVLKYSDDVFTRLRTIGDVLGKSKEAADWIAKYEAKAKEKKELLKSTVKPGETAAAFISYQDKMLYVYAGQNLGTTLYDALGFTPPPKVAELLAKNKNLPWQSISVEALPEYAADRIFLVVNEANADVKKRSDELMNSPVWRNLPAVKNGKAYVIGSNWALYNPLTLDMLLDEMPKLLMK